MLNPIILLIILLPFTGWLPALATATEYTFTTLDAPDAATIEALGVNVTHRFPTTPAFKLVKMDIEPACFNQDDKGVIPVGIFGSAGLDVTQINIDTLSLQGLPVNKYPPHYDFVNDDNHLDLIVQFEDSDGRIASGNDHALLTGKLNTGAPIEGKGTICIIP